MIRMTKDGFEITRLTKTIYVDGKPFKMVSHDGISWVQLKNEKQELQRIRNAARAKGTRRSGNRFIKDPGGPERWLKEQRKQVLSKIETEAASKRKGSKERPVILPVQHHGAPMIGKSVGKKHLYKRNLRQRVPTRDVKIAKPVHFHTCHGKHHPKKREAKFSCSCDKPKVRRYCGGTFCLFEGGDS